MWRAPPALELSELDFGRIDIHIRQVEPLMMDSQGIQEYVDYFFINLRIRRA